jgi:hypothetical protein
MKMAADVNRRAEEERLRRLQLQVVGTHFHSDISDILGWRGATLNETCWMDQRLRSRGGGGWGRRNYQCNYLGSGQIREFFRL